ncbi:hypothetical protein [Streptomyces sp. RPT161]|uniref:hypothetical protein n=1 Tax=Streptomyces sp. RPT161 TaxID=3015993 RepID=UPI0022B857F4|nr:hypothetical protein [Streptomyces sp. RPT161]
MAAGLLNTLRLGSEAVAVAVYGSLLATTLTSKIRAGIGQFADAGDPSKVANELASGNLSGPASAVSSGQRFGFTDFLVGTYDSAFHTILWILATVCLILFLIIGGMVRGSRPDSGASVAAKAIG